MRVGLSIMAVGRRAGGAETYEINLLRHLPAADPEHRYHVFGLGRSGQQALWPQQPNVICHRLRSSSRWIALPVSLPLALLANRIELYHATFMPPPFSPIPYVFTMHCFSTFVHPEFYPPEMLFRLNRLIRRGLKKARLVLCVSHNVAELTAERLGVPRERLEVIYHGVDEGFRPVPAAQARAALKERFGIAGPYVLYVGNLQARKNTKRLLEAFTLLRRRHPDLRLVLAGRRTYKNPPLHALLDREVASGFVMELGHLQQADLSALYSAAELFVFPSLWEGFGMPVIEAMACGAPVITSNVSSLPEIAGDAAMLIDPTSLEQLVDAMDRVCSDQSLRQALCRRGLQRASQFSWQQAARLTAQAYRKAARV